jgi:hypothetical protein
MHDNVLGEYEPLFKEPATKNKAVATCPLHGDIAETISSSIEGHEGIWCMRCVIDLLKHSVPACKPIEEASSGSEESK